MVWQTQDEEKTMPEPDTKNTTVRYSLNTRRRYKNKQETPTIDKYQEPNVTQKGNENRGQIKCETQSKPDHGMPST